MTPCNKDEFYLKNGRLDLSSLDKKVCKNEIEQVKPQIDDGELLELQSNNITTTLEEMALMFEEDSKDVKKVKEVPNNEWVRAFSPKRLKEEMQEFGIDK